MEEECPKDNNDIEEKDIREREFKERINQLENDLNKERNIYDVSSKNSETIINMKKEILSKENEIKNIMDLNDKQKKQLELISREIDLKLKKLSSNTTQINTNPSSINNNIDNNDMKLKEKQINNLNNLIEILQNDNEYLKNKLDYIYSSGSGNDSKFKLIELDKKILALNQDIKQKKLILQKHNKCISIKNQILKKISLIQEEINVEKEKNSKFKKKLESIENRYLLIKKEYENKIKSKVPPANNFPPINKTSNKFFTQNELNAIFFAVNNNKEVFENILSKFEKCDLNRREGNIYMEKQIEILQNEQKINKIKINKINIEINEIEKNNSMKNKEISNLMNELNNLKAGNGNSEPNKKLLNRQMFKIKPEPNTNNNADIINNK